MAVSGEGADERAGGGLRDIPLATRFGKLAGQLGRAAVLGGAVGTLWATSALANPPAPSLKPAPTLASTWIEASELRSLEKALDAADNDDWPAVHAAQARLSDPAAQALVRWRILTDGNGGSSFSDLMSALQEFHDWPGRGQIEDQMEIGILRSSLTAEERIAWLSSRGPRTGEGVLALADSYDSQGKHDDMIRVVRSAWRTMPLTNTSGEFLARYGSELTADDHYARADMFLWRGDTAAAQALEHRLSAGRKALVEARIGLKRNAKKLDKLLKAVPDAYEQDPGLLYDRARYAERRGRDSEQLGLLLRIRGESAPDVAREEIWAEKQSEMRAMLRERNYTTAYQLAAGHGLTHGDAFRDAEWTAGWIALSRLDDPVKAETHFRVFMSGVSTPISVSRAQYWLGQALERQKKTEEAQTAYEAAAAYPYVFYGQLAAEKIARRKPEALKLSFAPLAAPTDAERAEFARRPAVRAAILLAEAGRLDQFERFCFALDDVLTTPGEHQMLFDIATGYLQMKTAVRGAKAGLGRGLVAPDAVFPLMELPPTVRSGAAEPAMVLALSRQESEFNPGAVSGAGARGLMQLIPRYAQAEARIVGLPYRASWLTDDPQYNLKLGRGFLDDLVDEFGGSYILAAAAYNAGPSRARQWIQDYGDPRLDADPVDWIESIPFSETRNYVQRVLENTQVYRARLAGAPVEIKLTEDLKRGRPR